MHVFQTEEEKKQASAAKEARVNAVCNPFAFPSSSLQLQLKLAKEEERKQAMEQKQKAKVTLLVALHICAYFHLGGRHPSQGGCS